MKNIFRKLFSVDYFKILLLIIISIFLYLYNQNLGIGRFQNIGDDGILVIDTKTGQVYRLEADSGILEKYQEITQPILK